MTRCITIKGLILKHSGDHNHAPFVSDMSSCCYLCTTLGVTHTVHLWLDVDFLLAIIERFLIALTAEALLNEICQNLCFLKVWVTLSTNFCPHDNMLARVLAVVMSVCVCVCLSVTGQYCIKNG